MTDFLRHLTMTLAGIIVFGSICEMILPDNKYKKYVHLSIGLMLVMAFIQPFAENKNFKEPEIPSFTPYAQSEEMETEVKEKVCLLYKEKINKKITDEIKTAFETEAQVKCVIDFGENNFGRINEINVKIKSSDIQNDKSISEKIKQRLKENYGVNTNNICVEQW